MAEGIRIAICDDEQKDREFIKETLNKYLNGQMHLFHIREFESGESFLESKESFDLIFMDIYMQEMTGMEVAKELRARGDKTKIAFCSTSKDFAVESYEVDALHYLIKDWKKETLYPILDKFFRTFPAGRSIEVKTGRERAVVLMQDILYVEASNKKCIIHTKNEDIEATMSMSELGELLRLPEFARPIRYAIVSLKEVVAVPTDVVRLSNGVEIPVSRGEKQNIRNAFTEYRWMVSKMNGVKG